MNSKETNQSLPQEVLSVGHRIGLNQKTSKNIIESFVGKVLPKSVAESELRFQSYLLNEKQNSFNLRPKQRKRKNGLNSKIRKKLFDLKTNDLKFETFAKINELWHQYIDSIINDIKTKADEIRLIRADFHGSYFIVCASKNPTLIGIKGYVVQETKHTFKLINNENRLLTVPKDNTVFAFEHKGVVTKLNGYNLKMSSHHRSRAKPKLKLNEILIDI